MKIGLILKNDRLRRYYVMSWIIIVLNLVAQLMLTFTPSHENEKIFPILLLFLILLVIAGTRKWGKYYYIDKVKGVGLLLTYAVAIWIKWELYWFAALNAILTFSYFIATRKLEIIISEKSISYPSFPSRQIEWNELQNIVMRDSILTIDFKNDKLLQAEIETKDAFNESGFNTFCKEQLVK